MYGDGLEYGLRGKWTARAEYLFTDFRSFGAKNALGGGSAQHDLDTHRVRFGLTYKLGN